MKMPDRACDCHVHVIGSQSDYTMVPDRHYTPGPASVSDLRAHTQRIGASRAVIVQPSVYGTDNRCTLDALAALDGQARGIVVLPDDVTDAHLGELTDQGVVGLRLNLESAGNRNAGEVADTLKKWAARLARYRWHLQVYASFDVVQASLDRFSDLPVPVVLDHFAMVPANTSPRDAGLDHLLNVLRGGNVYLKLSASYRLEANTAKSIANLATAMISANPDRVLWASDWPHTNREPNKPATQVSAYRNVSAQALLAEVDEWLLDDTIVNRLLVENAERLYRF